MRIFLVVALLMSAANLHAQGERLFYYVDREEAYRSLVAHIDQITVLGPQSYTVDSLGTFFGAVDARVLRLAKEHHVKMMPLFVNEGFNQPALRRLLSDDAAQRRSVDAMVAACRRNGYWGIQFDVENLNELDRDRFTKWYTEAAAALHAAGFAISIAVVHRTDEAAGPTAYHRFLQESWRGGYDLAAIGRVSDFVSIMSYDQHTRRTPPGPVAGLTWVRENVDYFLRYVPAEKLSLGIPLYGDHWFARADPSIPDQVRPSSETVSWRWGSHLAERANAPMRWEETDQVPFAYYPNGGTYEWLFLENARSFQAKLALLQEKKLRGFSAWVLGPEDEEIWTALPKLAASR
ncbi:MAG TPA: glycosyl hydrolase family 18 protein [Gemmatimonadaceae bacterium]|nr:glycosyl hydrolase family 18 protein [Gemmatimonadaceae bacterium]